MMLRGQFLIRVSPAPTRQLASGASAPCGALRNNRNPADRGYAMAVLMVALGVMAILWTAALPVWNQLAKREKEEELIFRGTQYSRAIGMFQRKYANASPPSLDVLIDQKFLRRKYKDPMVPNGEFQLLNQTTPQPGRPGIGQQQGQRGAGPPASSTTQGGLAPGFSSTTQITSGGIIGVASKSKETSLRVYNGRTHYNEWQFIYLVTTQQPGVGGPGGAAPGLGVPGGAAGRGGRGDGRGAPAGPGSFPQGPGRFPQGPSTPGRGAPQFPPPGTGTTPLETAPQPRR